MFARGEFELGSSSALTRAAERGAAARRLQLRVRAAARQPVTQVKVETGRRVGDRIEITDGLRRRRARRRQRRRLPDRRRPGARGRRAGGDGAAPPPRQREQARRSHDERLGLVDPQPDPGGAAVRPAHRSSALLGFKAMKIQNFPDIDLPTVTVTASLPGAAPAQLETDVARKIENSIATLQGVKHIYTKVQDGAVTHHRRVPPREAGAGSGRRRARRGRARARRPAGRPARPGHHQARPRRRSRC